jgi:23S rRNA (pseudouridine1915-N3)-methyltransferase
LALRIGVIAIGRVKAGPERQLVSRYLERAIAAGKPLGLSGFEVVELPESRATSPMSRKADEIRSIRAVLPAGTIFVALDEHGKSMGSADFAGRIARWRDDGKAGLAFVLGGPDGLDPALLDDAALTLSLSALTWPHQLARIMLAEQLYRATTILSGHPYHRGQ